MDVRVWHYLSLVIRLFFPRLFYASNTRTDEGCAETRVNMTHVRSRAFLGSLAQAVNNIKEVDLFVSPPGLILCCDYHL